MWFLRETTNSMFCQWTSGVTIVPNDKEMIEYISECMSGLWVDLTTVIGECCFDLSISAMKWFGEVY